MFTWIGAHIGVILICLALAAIVAGAVIVLVRDKKKGRSCGCGGSCGCCPMGDTCHKQEED